MTFDQNLIVNGEDLILVCSYEYEPAERGVEIYSEYFILHTATNAENGDDITGILTEKQREYLEDDALDQAKEERETQKINRRIY